jgi:hypothetical protein
MPTARTLQDQELVPESKDLRLQKQRALGSNLAERKVESAWPGKATGRDSVNATISMCTAFLVGTTGANPRLSGQPSNGQLIACPRSTVPVAAAHS